MAVDAPPGVAVTFRTTAVALSGTPSTPRTTTSKVWAWPTGCFGTPPEPSRVSNSRTGSSGTYVDWPAVGAVAASAAGAEMPGTARLLIDRTSRDRVRRLRTLRT